MGNAKNRFDDKGREKVQCRECNLWFHRLDIHINKEHGGIEKYQADHPNAPIMSETGRKSKPSTNDEELFKFGVARLKLRNDLTSYDKKFIPVHDENWVLGVDEREWLEALSLGIEDHENILLVGPPGIGKSTLVKELGAICNQPLRRTSFRGDMRSSDLIGKGSLTIDKESGQQITDYSDGILPDSAQRGHWLLIDEVDGGPAEVMFLLFPVLEDDRSLTLTGKGSGYSVKFNHNFRVIGTANTLGFGDETGMFAGTAPMNEALLDRFHTVIKMDYPTPDNELDRIVSCTKVDKAVAEKMVAVANQIREAQKNEVTAASLSPRRVAMWARKTVRLGDVRRAAKYSVTNRLPKEEGVYVEGIIQRHFGGAVT